MNTEAQASILLVEDDASLAEWILQYLRGHNYQLQHIDRGDQVLASVKQQPPELIILDVMLPYKNGFDLCRELRGYEYDGFDRSIYIRFRACAKKLFDNTEQLFRSKTIGAKGDFFHPKVQNNCAALDSVSFAGSAHRRDRSRLESYNAREASIMLL